MIVALLALLGVSLWAIVAIAALMLARRRWLAVPSPFGSSLLEVLDVIDQRAAEAGEVRRLGPRPVVVQLRLRTGATIAVALRDEHAAPLRGAVPVRRASGTAGSV